MELGLGNLATGLIDGYQVGRKMKRQDEQDALHAEERGLRMDTLRTQNANAAEDRQLRLTEGAEDRQHELQQRERTLKQQQREDAEDAYLRKRFALMDAAQNDPAQGDALVNAIEDDYANDPLFDDGYVVKFARNADGSLIKDEKGRYRGEQFTKDGKPTGVVQTPTANELTDGILGRLSPAETFKSRRDAAAAGAKDAREHKQKKEIEQMGHDSAEKVARINADSRLAVAEAKAAIAESRGKGVVESQADRRVQTIGLMKAMKDDNSLKYHTDANGKPDFKRPRSYQDQYKEVYGLLYGEDDGGGASPPPQAAPKPAARSLTAPGKSGAAPQYVRTGMKDGRRIGQLADGTIVDIATGKAVK